MKPACRLVSGMSRWIPLDPSMPRRLHDPEFKTRGWKTIRCSGGSAITWTPDGVALEIKEKIG
jgi:hypothetical protein